MIQDQSWRWDVAQEEPKPEGAQRGTHHYDTSTTPFVPVRVRAVRGRARRRATQSQDRSRSSREQRGRLRRYGGVLK